MKVYAICSDDMLAYDVSVSVREVYATREAAENHLPEGDEYYRYFIEEWEVSDE